MRDWEDFGGVGEWHGTFTGRVEDVEEVYEKCDATQMSGPLLFWNPETEAGC